MSDTATGPAGPLDGTGPPGRTGARAGWAARLGVVGVFFVQGLLFASWAAHIPHVRLRLGLSDAGLGVALLGAPVGSIAAMAVSARALPRLGSRRLVRLHLVGYAAAGPLVGLAGSALWLFAALAAWGFFQGSLDMAMNTQAIAVERRDGRVLMPGFHGGWSLGAFAGAGLGTLGVALGVGLTAQLAVLGAACVAVGLVAAAPMIADPALLGGEARPGRRFTVRPVLVVLGALAVADLLCEGAAADWASVYLRTSLGASEAAAGLGYTLYTCTMAAVRLAGNRLVVLAGTRRLVAGLAGVAAVVLAIGLATGTTAGALVGFAVLGAGLASVIPTVFSAAGRVPGTNPGAAVSTVAAVGWIGYVAGPPLIGQLAAAVSLRGALVTVPVLTGLVAVVAARLPVLADAHGVPPSPLGKVVGEGGEA